MRHLGIAGFTLAAALLAAGSIGADQTARLRIIHASPDAPAVDVWVDGRVAGKELTFGKSSGYLDVPAGKVSVAIAPTGSTKPVAGPATLEFAPGSLTTVAAIGLAGGGEPGLSLLTLEDGAPRADQARLRVIHAAPGAPAVDVWLGGKPAIQALAYGKATDVIELSDGTFPVEIRVAGTDDRVYGPLDLALKAGRSTTVFAIGRVGGEPAFRLAAFAEQVFATDLSSPAQSARSRKDGKKSGRDPARKGERRSRAAGLPDGWSEIGAIDKIVVKRYPASRVAFRMEHADDGAAVRAFWPLYLHIRLNGFPMTRPVVVDYTDADRDRVRVGFLYPGPDRGRTGRGLMVWVEDLEPVTVASVALKGPYNMDTRERGVAILEDWLSEQSVWEASGPARHLMYENPTGKDPAALLNEIQIPLKPVASGAVHRVGEHSVPLAEVGAAGR